MKRKSVIIAVAIGLVAMSIIEQEPASASDLITRAQAAVRKQLKDPDSAKFSEVFSKTAINVKGKQVKVVCGSVNAKNSFGGYTGSTPFIVFTDDMRADLVSHDTTDVMNHMRVEMVRRFCVGNGFTKEEIAKDQESRKTFCARPLDELKPFERGARSKVCEG